jgi:hypothetical protein
VEGTLSHVDMESDSYSMNPALGVITLYDCGGNSSTTQFLLNFDGMTESEAPTVFNTGILMSPPNDMALQLTAENSSINGGSPAGRWVGLPALQRSDLGGSNGWVSLLNYAPPFNSIGTANYAAGMANYVAPAQLMSDVNIGQLWQYGIKAFDFLSSDTGFAALPNGTTVYAGQILAPPAYWSGANGKRYGLDVVYQTGTTGIPNSGATTCTTSATAAQFVCSSATDLSVGQIINVGSATSKQVKYIDATNPTSVLVWTTAAVGTIASPAALSFAAPLMGPEMQLPSKSAGAPTSLAWLQGDMEQNSGATANGVAAWVNVSAGTPGTWAGVPLGNSSGQITPAQITTPSVTVNGQTCTLGASCTVTSGAGNVTGTPPWLQYLGPGGTAEVCNGSLNTDLFYSSFSVPFGDTCTATTALTIHVTGTCTIAGTITATGGANKVAGGSGGGGGGGTAAGTAGTGSSTSPFTGGITIASGGTAGAASGGAGGAASSANTGWQNIFTATGGGADGAATGGGPGGSGGSSGGSGGAGGYGVTLICGQIAGTDGTHTGVINANGSNGSAAPGNNTGSGGGGGGGLIVLSSQSAVSTWPTLNVAGGSGGSCGAFTGCGAGGSGAAGLTAEFQGW